MHHKTSNSDRLTIARTEGGRGLIHLMDLHNKQIKILRHYFHSRENDSLLHHSVCNADEYTVLKLKDRNVQSNERLTTEEETRNRWKSKALHGRHPHDLDQPHVDERVA